MGFGFVIIIHFIVIFIISCLIAVVSGLTTYFVSNKEKKKRKVFLALIIPFQALFTIYLLVITGSIIISEIKNVDIGIGDSWYAPLNDSSQILMIDLPEQAFLECNGQSIISNITHIQQINDDVYGKLISEEYFTYNLANSQYNTYSNITEFTNAIDVTNLNLIDLPEFYYDRKWEVSGFATIIVWIWSLLLTILIIVIFCKFTLHGWRKGVNTKTTTNNI